MNVLQIYLYLYTNGYILLFVYILEGRNSQQVSRLCYLNFVCVDLQRNHWVSGKITLLILLK
mgnify:CR=1 FL=1